MKRGRSWTSGVARVVDVVQPKMVRVSRVYKHGASRAHYQQKFGSGQYSRAAVKGPVAPYGGRKELKYVDTVLQSNTQVYDTTGLATPVNLIAVGDDNTTRDGRQVCIKSVAVRGKIDPVDATSGPSLCRTMLVWDNANNGASTSSATLIAALLVSADARSFPSVDNANRFTILWDSLKVLSQIDTTATQTLAPSPGVQYIKYYRKMNSVTQYIGTTAAIGSIQNGSLWFITIGDQAAAAGGRFNGQVRVRYTDP